VPLAAVLGAGAATASPPSNGIEFNVKLRGELFESRQIATAKKVSKDCADKTDGSGSLRIKFQSAAPSPLVVRQGANGAAVYLTRAIGRIAGAVSLHGSFLTNYCAGGASAGDCSAPPSRFRAASASFARISRGALRFGRLRPALPSSAPCAPGFPSSLPRLGLPLATGYVSEAKLLNPAIKSVTAEGYLQARTPVTVANGKGELIQRVHWQLTFTRV
jgi:hypothetical protein